MSTDTNAAIRYAKIMKLATAMQWPYSVAEIIYNRKENS